MKAAKLWVKKPVVVEALQFTGLNHEEVGEFVGDGAEVIKKVLFIKTLEGRMECGAGSYIVKGVKGEFYPVRLDIFLATYDQVQSSVAAPKEKDCICYSMTPGYSMNGKRCLLHESQGGGSAK